MPYKLDDRELGVIEVRERRSSSRFSARWKEGGLVVITPVGISRHETLKAIDAMRAQLLARRPAAMFEIGHPLQFDGGITYHFESSQLHPNKIMLHPSDNGGVVSIGSNLHLGTPTADAAISRLLIMSAYRLAHIHILPRAAELAAGLKLKPAGWKIARGRHTLGTCSGRRIISLSSLLIFLPQELRDYIIYHELAHLTEMNHSQRFHRLCNLYCGGREAELTRRLRNHRWQILR